MKKIGHILTGWGKATGLISTSTAEAKLSALRLKICGACDLSKKKKILEIINDEAVEENALVCTRCKCPCLEKSLVVDEECPIFRW